MYGSKGKNLFTNKLPYKDMNRYKEIITYYKDKYEQIWKWSSFLPDFVWKKDSGYGSFQQGEGLIRINNPKKYEISQM